MPNFSINSPYNSVGRRRFPRISLDLLAELLTIPSQLALQAGQRDAGCEVRRPRKWTRSMRRAVGYGVLAELGGDHDVADGS